MIRAILLLSGMIIGAGMFAIPFSFAQTGFWLGAAELAVLSAVVLGLHLLYAEIVLATPQFHRMPGYVRRYLGRVPAALSWVSSLFGIAGTLLAYLIVNTIFLQTIAAYGGMNAPSLWWVGILVGVIAVITFFPLKREATINSVLTTFEIAFIVILPLFLLSHVFAANVMGIHAEHLFVPFGVLLFALSGGSVIPDMITVLGRNRRKVRLAVVIGSLIPTLLYFFFAYAVVGVTGSATSAEAIAGLERALGGNVAWWASIAGFLAVLTSYIALSANMQAMLRLDMGVPRRAAWFAASALPPVLYLVGFQNFIAIISVVGIFAFGIDGALFFFMGRAVRKKQNIRSPLASLVGSAILAVIITGVIVELLRIF